MASYEISNAYTNKDPRNTQDTLPSPSRAPKGSTGRAVEQQGNSSNTHRSPPSPMRSTVMDLPPNKNRSSPPPPFTHEISDDGGVAYQQGKRQQRPESIPTPSLTPSWESIMMELPSNKNPSSTLSPPPPPPPPPLTHSGDQWWCMSCLATRTTAAPRPPPPPPQAAHPNFPPPCPLTPWDRRWWSCLATRRTPGAPKGGRGPGSSWGRRSSCARRGCGDSTHRPAWWWRRCPGTPGWRTAPTAESYC